MAVVVKNVGAIAFTATGTQNTKEGNLAENGDQGTVRVVYENREYVWGPNESKTLEDGIAAACVAASGSRLRVADTRDGIDRGQGRS